MLQLRRDPFNVLWEEVERVQSDLGKLFQPARPAVPLINLWEDETNLYAEADLPGFAADKFDVQISDGNTLVITGERHAPELSQAVWHRQERLHGAISRSVKLPVLVDADRVVAQYEHGVLRLKLPKSEAAKPRKITVVSHQS